MTQPDSSPPPPPRDPTRARVTNFLVYGFGLSIVLHLLVGPLVKFDRTQPEEEKVSVIRRDHIATPPPTPPPTPKPTPTPPPTPPPTQPPKTPPPKAPPPIPQPKIKITTAKTTATKGGATEAANTHTVGSTNGVPQGTSTAAATTPVPIQTAAAPPAPPTVAPTKPPSCANPNVEATTTNAVAPDTPPIAQQQGITGVVNVVINLDATNHIVGTPTVQSSPSQLLNSAAIRAAQQSTFRTEIKNCEPVAATYIFAVEFNNN